jgi:hypothetical protein
MANATHLKIPREFFHTLEMKNQSNVLNLMKELAKGTLKGL